MTREEMKKAEKQLKRMRAERNLNGGEDRAIDVAIRLLKKEMKEDRYCVSCKNWPMSEKCKECSFDGEGNTKWEG